MLFLLFNQSQRHAAAKGVASAVKARKAQEFIDLVNNPEFQTLLNEAVQNPEGDTAAQISRQLLPLLRVSGGKVPFGSVERAQSLSKMYSMVHLFGLPSWFITIAPSEPDSVLTMWRD